ncbi:MAG: hypothetical protein ACO331_15175 [Prochlorothrix sp.]
MPSAPHRLIPRGAEPPRGCNLDPATPRSAAIDREISVVRLWY